MEGRRVRFGNRVCQCHVNILYSYGFKIEKLSLVDWQKTISITWNFLVPYTSLFLPSSLSHFLSLSFLPLKLKYSSSSFKIISSFLKMQRAMIIWYSSKLSTIRNIKLSVAHSSHTSSWLCSEPFIRAIYTDLMGKQRLWKKKILITVLRIKVKIVPSFPKYLKA